MWKRTTTLHVALFYASLTTGTVLQRSLGQSTECNRSVAAKGGKETTQKKNPEVWSNGKRALATEAKKKCISSQHDDVPISVVETPNNQQLSKKAQSKKKKTTKTKRKANSASRRKK